MEKYKVRLSKKAVEDLEALKKSAKRSDFAKVSTLFREIETNPRKGTGQPEQLKYYEGEVWSRRINKKDRLVYEIFESEIVVVVVSALGHYGDR